MKAILIRGHGGLEQARIEEVPKPEPRPGEVLVKVRASSFNHLDLWVMGGMPGLKVAMPHVLGSDAVGEVEGKRVLVRPGISCGECEACRKGEESLCRKLRILGEHKGGTFAEFICVPAENIEPAPEHLSDEEAGTFPLVFLTAWRMLKTRARVEEGETILITGIGGGVATAALVLAKALGLKILVTTGSPDKIQKAVKEGAEDGIYHGTGDFSKWVREKTEGKGVDVVLDSSGKSIFESCLKSLARGGRYVTCGATSGATADAQLARVFWNQLSVLGSTLGSRAEFKALLAFAIEKRLRPILDGTYPMADFSLGLKRLQAGEQFGKIGLRIP